MTLVPSRRRFIQSGAAASAAAALFPRGLRAQELSGALSVWKFGGTPREVEFWPQRNAAFNRRHPNLKLDYSFFYGQIRRQRIQAGFQTRRLAEVVIGFGQDIPEFAGFNMIQPIDQLDPAAVASWKAAYVPEVWQTGLHEGKLYGLPTYVDIASFLAISVDALKEAGLDGPPTTWSELKEYARKMTKPGRPGIAFPLTTQPTDTNIFEGVAYANGGRIYDEASGKVMLADPGVADALALYVDLIKEGLTPPPAAMTETNFRDTANLFAQGRVAMWVGVSWLNAPWPVPDGFRWIGVPFPRPDKPSGSKPPVNALLDPTSTLMVSSLSKNPKAAVSYVGFWAEPEQLALWGGEPEYSRVPAGRDVFKMAELRRRAPDWVAAYEQGVLFNGAESLPRFIGVSQVETALAAALQQAALGRKTTAEALGEAQAAAQRQIDLIRG